MLAFMGWLTTASAEDDVHDGAALPALTVIVLDPTNRRPIRRARRCGEAIRNISYEDADRGWDGPGRCLPIRQTEFNPGVAGELEVYTWDGSRGTHVVSTRMDARGIAEVDRLAPGLYAVEAFSWDSDVFVRASVLVEEGTPSTLVLWLPSARGWLILH